MYGVMPPPYGLGCLPSRLELHLSVVISTVIRTCVVFYLKLAHRFAPLFSSKGRTPPSRQPNEMSKSHQNCRSTSWHLSRMPATKGSKQVRPLQYSKRMLCSMHSHAPVPGGHGPKITAHSRPDAFAKRWEPHSAAALHAGSMEMPQACMLSPEYGMTAGRLNEHPVRTLRPSYGKPLATQLPLMEPSPRSHDHQDASSPCRPAQHHQDQIKH